MGEPRRRKCAWVYTFYYTVSRPGLFQLGYPCISRESGTNQKHQTDPDHHKHAPKGFADSFPGLQRMPDTQLTMLTLENPSTQALRKLLPEFEHRSGIRVKLIGVPYDDLLAQLNLIGPHLPMI